MFIGRAGPLAAARAAVRSGAGIVVAGEAGAGKSRLLAEVVDGMVGIDRSAGNSTDGGGPTVIQAVGTQATSAIPLGAFAHALTGEPPPGNLLAWATGQLHAASRGRGELLLVVDDAHWLDSASASLVHHLVVHRRGRVLVTVRTGETPPDPVLALWKEELVERIDLEPLTSAEIAEVLTGILGGPIESSTVRYLAEASRGNLLYLRELIHAGCSTGVLSQVDRVGGDGGDSTVGRDGGDSTVGRDGGDNSLWCWRGELSMTDRLQDLVQSRIGRLEPDVAEVLELVAFGEPLNASILEALASPKAVEIAEDRGLIAIAADDRVWLGHPLYGETVRHRCGSRRTGRRLRQLSDAVVAAGPPLDGDDLLRVAVWRMDSGTADDPRAMLDATRLAWARHDAPLAARLGEAAVAAGGGVEAAAVLSQVLMVLGRADEATALLRRSTCDPVTATDRERAEHALSLGINLAWAGADDEACHVLDAAEATITDPAWRQEVLIYRGVVDFLHGRLTGAAQAHDRVHALGHTTVRGTAHAAALDAWVNAYAGKTRKSLSIAELALADVSQWRDEAPHAMPTLLDATCAANTFAGDLAAADRTAKAALRLVDAPGAWDLSVSAFNAHRALVSRLRGEITNALRWCREDCVRLRARTPYLGRCLGELAHAAALAGDLTTAKRVLAEAKPLAEYWAFTHLPVLLAGAWVAAAEGDIDTAVREAIAAAGAAEKHELAGYLMFALHDVVRLGAAPQVADQLSALAGTQGTRSTAAMRLDGPLVALCARHAAAAVADDGQGLRAVSEGFEQLGMLLYAAEASAHAAGAFQRAGRSPSARAAAARAWALSQQCPGVQTPALVELAVPQLTPRQREIAQLAATGLSNRQIADRLTVSLRTAANHLQAVYDKLGVNDRTEVASLLGPSPAPAAIE